MTTTTTSDPWAARFHWLMLALMLAGLAVAIVTAVAR